jgi:MYXO-CTERM domain-containing protein
MPYATWLCRALLLTALSTVLLPSEAQACGACVCDTPRFWTHPGPVDRDVPLDARIFVSSPTAPVESVRLLRASDGQEVPASLQPTGGPAHTRWLVPDAPLAPDSEYRVEAGAEQTTLYTQRRTGSAQVPVLGGLRVNLEGGLLRALCGSSVGVAFALDGAQVEGEPVQRTLVQVDVEGLPAGPRRLFLPPAAGDLALGHFLGQPGDTSARDCLGDAELGPVEPGELQMHVRLWDRSGRVSEPASAPLPLRAVTPADCGGPVPPPDGGTQLPMPDQSGLAVLTPRPSERSCSTTGQGAAAPALAAIALLVRRRRRAS